MVQTLEFTGRASPVLEQELFFETGGNVGEVFVARGDWVQAGDVLAELDIDDLQKQLSQKLLSLETAEIKYGAGPDRGHGSDHHDPDQAGGRRRPTWQSAKTTSANDLAAARASVTSAETSLDNAQLNLTIVQNSDTVVQEGARPRVRGQLVRGLLWRVPEKVRGRRRSTRTAWTWSTTTCSRPRTTSTRPGRRPNWP